MKTIINLLILLPVAIVLIVFSVANRQEVILGLDPFNPSDPVLSFTLPFFVFLFASFILGMIIGGTINWWRSGAVRRELRDKRDQVDILATENDELKSRTKSESPEFAPGLPIISSGTR